MPQRLDRARLRGLRPLALAAFVVPLVVLAALAGTINARPPSTPSPVPPEAFQPVVVPGESGVAATAPIPRRVPDDDLAESVTSPTPAAEPTPAGPIHVVRTGDSLWQIVIWHRVDQDVILRWNPDLDPRHLRIGERILVPGGKPMPAGARATSAAPMSHLWPLPVRGMITTYFSGSHPGIDIAAPAGTTVRAIAPGIVTWAGWRTGGFGYAVFIRHPNGMISRYSHNRRVLVTVGQTVSAGQKIAEVGSTGWSTGPHLDLRIRMADEFANPLRLDWTR